MPNVALGFRYAKFFALRKTFVTHISQPPEYFVILQYVAELLLLFSFLECILISVARKVVLYF